MGPTSHTNESWPLDGTISPKRALHVHSANPLRGVEVVQSPDTIRNAVKLIRSDLIQIKHVIFT